MKKLFSKPSGKNKLKNESVFAKKLDEALRKIDETDLALQKINQEYEGVRDLNKRMREMGKQARKNKRRAKLRGLFSRKQQQEPTMK